jgi:Family of unknown function (DUF5329)
MNRPSVLKPHLFVWLTLALFFLPTVATAPLAAQSMPPGERQKIEILIKQVGNLRDVTFIRNGSSYSAASAATFLRRKWEANDSRVKTAREFIDKVASFSGTSGKPYLIRFKNGEEIKSQDFLLAELGKLLTSSECAKTGAPSVDETKPAD